MSSRDRMRRTLIAYDVPDDRRRLRVARLLEQYGDRIQYSVFVVDLLPSKLLRLKGSLKEVIDPRVDSILLCDLGLVKTLTAAEFSYMGQQRSITPQGPMIL